MAGWAELPKDLIAHIANRVKVIEDFIAFRAVCTFWRISATKKDFDVVSPQVPLLMLGAKDDDYREFYSLSKKKVWRIFLPEARRSECLPNREGWLCTVENDTGEMNLLHPFSRKKIHLPSRSDILTFHYIGESLAFPPQGGNRWSCIDRAVLSANPCFTSDYVLMVHHYKPKSCLVVWRPGDLDWTHMDVVNYGGVAALIYYQDQFYSMSYCGQVRAYQVAGPNSPSDQPIVQTRLLAEMDPDQFNVPDVRYYLVELSGALLLVSRFANSTFDDPNGILHTFKFKVSELDLIKGELKEEMKTLGDSSIFLGRNWATCIESDGIIKPNHIYFTDDGLEYHRDVEGGAGRDMGAYNLKDGKIESFYPGLSISLICPPVWVMPSII